MKKNAHGSRVEALEFRRLLAFIFKATSGDDFIHLGNLPNGFFLDINGKRTVVPVAANDINHGGFMLDCMAGNDKVLIDADFKYRDYIYGGSGKDTLIGGDGQDALYGGANSDVIYGNGGNDALYGGSGNDIIHGGVGPDQIFGDNPTDSATQQETTHAGNDRLFGDDGGDGISGGGGNDYIEGDAGTDRIYGGDGNDTMLGGDGNDTLEVGRATTLRGNDSGDDIYDGGPGSDDVLDVEAGQPVSYSTDGIANDGLIDGGHDNIFGLEEFRLRVADGSRLDASASPVGIIVGFMDINSPFNGTPDHGSADTLIGSDFNDVVNPFYLGNIADIPGSLIQTGGGNDSIIGSQSNDTISGGDGNDTISAFDGNDSVNGDAGNDSIDGGGGNDTIFGGSGNDTIAGLDGNDLIEGNLGNDSIDGGGGKDTLSGNKGVDTLFGASGDDLLYGGPDSADHIIGGPGFDRAARDSKDIYTSVEKLLA